MNAIELINESSDAFVGKGASDAEIWRAEEKLQLTFADDYKNYLRTFGAVMLNGHELSGISKAKQMDVVELTVSKRTYINCISPELYVLEDCGIDDIVIWQDSKGIVYETQNGKQKKIKNSLAEYIEEIVL